MKKSTKSSKSTETAVSALTVAPIIEAPVTPTVDTNELRARINATYQPNLSEKSPVDSAVSERQRIAAYKAWVTIRAKRAAKAAQSA